MIDLFRSALLVLVGLCLTSPVYSTEIKAIPLQRQKVIDFEGDLVEGVNKRPLDSLSEISEARKHKKKTHLYRKRKGFRTESLETLREMRLIE